MKPKRKIFVRGKYSNGDGGRGRGQGEGAGREGGGVKNFKISKFFT